MAQPAEFVAQDNQTDMGSPVFWASARSDPPWNFRIWLDQFRLAVTVKQNVNPEIILEDPKEVVDEPIPRPETPGEAGSAQAVTEREARDSLRRDKVIFEKQERRERGPKVGHNVFKNDLCLVYSCHLVPRGKRNLCRKSHTRNLEKWWYWPKHHWKKHKNITYERYRIFTRAQETMETLESFHAALTAQAATAELGGLEEELVRDLFISRMKKTALHCKIL